MLTFISVFCRVEWVSGLRLVVLVFAWVVAWLWRWCLMLRTFPISHVFSQTVFCSFSKKIFFWHLTRYQMLPKGTVQFVKKYRGSSIDTEHWRGDVCRGIYHHRHHEHALSWSIAVSRGSSGVLDHELRPWYIPQHTWVKCGSGFNCCTIFKDQTKLQARRGAMLDP